MVDLAAAAGKVTKTAVDGTGCGWGTDECCVGGMILSRLMGMSNNG